MNNIKDKNKRLVKIVTEDKLQIKQEFQKTEVQKFRKI